MYINCMHEIKLLQEINTSLIPKLCKVQNEVNIAGNPLGGIFKCQNEDLIQTPITNHCLIIMKVYF